MYKVYCDSLLMYHSKLESLKISDASIELELNKTGSFLFTVYPDHPHYSLIRKLKSIVTVYQDDYLLFRGRYNGIRKVDQIFKAIPHRNKLSRIAGFMV